MRRNVGRVSWRAILRIVMENPTSGDGAICRKILHVIERICDVVPVCRGKRKEIQIPELLLRGYSQRESE